MSEHGHCPSCGVSLDGGSIWQTFRDKGETEEEADRIAAMYGATRERGTWGRAISMYDRDKDMTVSYRCPDCGHTWPRK